MEFRVLSLNCQKNYNKNLRGFLRRVLKGDKYNVFLLQEATREVLDIFDEFSKYKVVSSYDKLGRLSLPSVVYDSSVFGFRKFFYEPILVDGLERQEIKRPFQSFGIMRVDLSFGKKRFVFASVHLASGFSKKRRFRDLEMVRKVVGKGEADVRVFGGDCNFCFSSEVRDACRIVGCDYECLTLGLGATLDSYYTESHLKYSWVYLNNILRRFGGRIRLCADHVFLDKVSFNKGEFRTKVLKSRVSDHSPVEMILKL